MKACLGTDPRGLMWKRALRLKAKHTGSTFLTLCCKMPAASANLETGGRDSCSTKVEVLGTDWSATLTTAKFVRIFAPLSLAIAAWCAASGLDDHLKSGF